MSETDGNGNWKHTNVDAAGMLVATYDMAPTGVPALHFQLEDWLGTRRVQTDISGNPEETYVSLPFGDGFATSIPSGAPATADDATEHHFTGKERDAESGNDYFGARYYASSMGRWMSPDWSAKEEPVPNAKLDNPQSLNLYAYVANNPMTRFDPDGHTLAKQEDVSVYFSPAVQGKKSWFAKWTNQRTLVFRYDPDRSDAPLPSITSLSQSTILISIPEVSSVSYQNRKWKNMSVNYEIGKVDYPPKSQ